MSALVLGIDVGTSGVRAALIDTSGCVISSSSVEWETDYPRSGYAEQNPDVWWEGICQVVRKAISGYDPGRIAGIGVDATSATVVLCKRNGAVLRPAIMWMDIRASQEARLLTNSGDPALKYAGHDLVSAEWGTPKLMWVKRHEPEVWERTEVIADCLDYLTFRMCGEWTASICNTSCKFFYDSNWGGWPVSLYEVGGIPEAIELFPKRVLNLGDLAGTLNAQAAEEMGLIAGIPIAEGGIDAHVGAIGLGVVEPGSMALITGSSHVMLGQTTKAVYANGIWGAYANAIIPGQYTVEAGQVSTGSTLAWFVKNYCPQALAKARAKGQSPYKFLDEQASKVPIGANGVVALDHFQGNRTPFVDSHSRGAFIGLSLSHTEADLYRAVMESVCYGTGAIFDTFRQKGFIPQSVMVSGGPTGSPLWMQMHADVTGVPINVPSSTGGPILGSAMLACLAAGIYRSAEEAASEMVRMGRCYKPDPQRHQEYRFYLEQYLEIYRALSPITNRLLTREE